MLSRKQLENEGMARLTLRSIDLQQMSSPTATRDDSPGHFRLYVDPKATLVAIHAPATLPLHWQDEVEEQLNGNIALGVLESTHR